MLQNAVLGLNNNSRFLVSDDNANWPVPPDLVDSVYTPKADMVHLLNYGLSQIGEVGVGKKTLFCLM